MNLPPGEQKLVSETKKKKKKLILFIQIVHKHKQINSGYVVLKQHVWGPGLGEKCLRRPLREANDKNEVENKSFSGFQMMSSWPKPLRTLLIFSYS